MKYSLNVWVRFFFNGKYTARLAKSRARYGSSTICASVNSGLLVSLPRHPLYVNFSRVAAATDVPWNTTWCSGVVVVVVVVVVVLLLLLLLLLKDQQRRAQGHTAYRYDDHRFPTCT